MELRLIRPPGRGAHYCEHPLLFSVYLEHFSLCVARCNADRGFHLEDAEVIVLSCADNVDVLYADAESV